MEDNKINKSTLAQRMESITAEIDIQSKRRIQILKELESNDSVHIPYEIVKDTLSNFNRLLENTAPEDKIIKKDLLCHCKPLVCL